MFNIADFYHKYQNEFIRSLIEVDRHEAKLCQEKGCPHCGGELDVSNYPRKPRGIGAKEVLLEGRLSFTCRRCRLRTTPPSVCFFHRKVYLSFTILVVGYLRRREPEAVPLRRLSSETGVSERMIVHWLHWWEEFVFDGDFWRSVRSKFVHPLGRRGFVYYLLESFRVSSRPLKEALLNLSRFISPLSIRAPGLVCENPV